VFGEDVPGMPCVNCIIAAATPAESCRDCGRPVAMNHTVKLITRGGRCVAMVCASCLA
jgi:hypothetical protein